MKLCFNQATTIGNSTLKKDLELCEKFGYDLIEIRLDKLKEYLETHTIEDLAAFFSASHLKPYAFNALEHICFRDEAGWNALMESTDLFCKVGDAIDCHKIVVVPTPDVGNKTIGEIKAEAVKAIKAISERANGKMNLAFEFVGYPNLCVNTFGQAYDIVKACDMDNVGIVLDCFHFHAMGSRIEDLEKMDITKLSIFHIDDSEDLPVGAAVDANRLWPGDGAINLAEIFTVLKNKGYEEMASVELFRPEYYALDAADTIRIAKEKSIKALAPFWQIN